MSSETFYACGCSHDKVGCTICGNCDDHCNCPGFDEIGSSGNADVDDE